MATQAKTASGQDPAGRFEAVRSLSRSIAAPLSDADATIQPMPDASPAKWHLAHTSWFFETFVLRDHVPGYSAFDERYAYLFNSYYEGEGDRHARPKRGMLSRPSLGELLDYREHVDAAVVRAVPKLPPKALALLDLGLNHEQQHQELMLMDMLATFAGNPLLPAVREAGASTPASLPAATGWIEGRTGIQRIGHAGTSFAFDCEGPAHEVLLRPHALADRLVTNAEWLSFIEDGGYQKPGPWLSDGWAWVREQQIEAPLYWMRGDHGWSCFGLHGVKPLNRAEPVCHISYFEADAFARWAGARLPTEAEWETAAKDADPAAGSQLDDSAPARPAGGGELFGDAWQWTMSAFLPHPGFEAAKGPVGEYNGK
ncbi:MAG TPA: ergothioneine biosynthesis protein EgtB, partial [Allosphingosinicella sp.]